MWMLVTGTCISCPLNMDDKIGGVVWCSSGIIFGSYSDGGLARLNVYYFLSCCYTWSQEIIIIRCYNCNPWSCVTIGELVLVMVFAVLLTVLVIPIIMLFICLVKLFFLFTYMVETLVIVYSEWSGGMFTIYSGLINFVMNIVHFINLVGFGY